MFDYLKGKLVSKLPTHVSLEVNGVGYGVDIPLSIYDHLPELKSQVLLYTYLQVREDCLQLFGFATEEEKDLFQMLISVSGIGPRVALAALSGLSVLELEDAIRQGKVVKLTSISGIGKKTAQRIILELKEKVTAEKEKEELAEMAPTASGSRMISDAIAALVSLGCKAGEAAQAVKKTLEEVSAELELEELIKQSLRRL